MAKDSVKKSYKPSPYSATKIFHYQTSLPEQKAPGEDRDDRAILVPSAGYKPGPVAAGDLQAVRDWYGFRNQYFINGRSFSQLVREHKGIELTQAEDLTIDILRDIFKLEMFKHIKDSVLQDQLVEQALLHFHQSGLPHAVSGLFHEKLAAPGFIENDVILNKATEKNLRVDFLPVQNGVLIREKAVYNTKTKTDDRATLTAESQGLPYFASTNAVMSLTVSKGHFSKEYNLAVSLHQLKVDAPDQSAEVQAVFGKGYNEDSIIRQLLQWLQNLFGTARECLKTANTLESPFQIAKNQ